MSKRTGIVWFGQDLRVGDHPALAAAVRQCEQVLCVYIHAPEELSGWQPGGASRWWLHHALADLGASLRARGGRLVLLRGPTEQSLRQAIRRSGAGSIYWNERYEPAVRRRDASLRRRLEFDGLDVQVFPGSLLHDPQTLLNKQGKPYQVFTSFWKSFLSQGRVRKPVSAPRRQNAPQKQPEGVSLASLDLLPRPDWAEGIDRTWEPSEAAAQRKLQSFVKRNVVSYGEMRDRPDREGVSRLSPYLHFGQISPVQVWQAVQDRYKDSGSDERASVETYLREIGWREFAYHLLVYFPHTTDRPLRESFRRFGWRRNRRWLRAWQQGKTGYPMVDAAMRQLWHTGWMHNRMRMVVASFLTKHLLIPWQDGAAWFWDTLVDADLASNTLGWQWTAGCGADAAPYYRIFNPVTQGRKFDPEGAYVRCWVPELVKLPSKYIHAPREAPAEVLQEAGVRVGQDYPEPIVEHRQAREKALRAYEKIKGGGARTHAGFGPM